MTVVGTVLRTRPAPTGADVRARFESLLDQAAALPTPGRGRTIERWRAFVRVAEIDLALAKLYESHMDALAIHDELGIEPPRTDSRWGVWAAQRAGSALQLTANDRLFGRKHWCSGASFLSHAVVTATAANGERALVAVALDSSTMRIDAPDWEAPGMADTHTTSVEFHGARGVLIGTERDYLERAGFWYGAAGIAACWYGGALALARTLHRSDRVAGDPHLAAHLGGG